jgi:23S rRNA (cytidine1920-2'-O)/16S rRNA (cytidine1409-2'-O)-methyltransferase
MRKRLDQALVEGGFVATRSRARDAIARGLVRVAGAVASKPGTLVEGGEELVVLPEAGAGFVSRGALKLEAALTAFGYSAEDCVALDVGASTGGFTEVLLASGARRVYAVDVGHDQLHARLRSDPRVVALEGQDARALTRDLVPEPIAAITADVSFIALEKALPKALALAAPGAWLVALIKPQFEVGPKGVGKGGIVRDIGLRDAAVARFSAWLGAQPRWRVEGIVPSPVAGGSGNEEFLLGARFNG